MSAEKKELAYPANIYENLVFIKFVGNHSLIIGLRRQPILIRKFDKFNKAI